MKNFATSDLRTLLATNIVRFTFRKADGTIRHAVGTRNLTLARGFFAKAGIDHEIPTPKNAEQPHAYYDLEKMAWRGYRLDSVISIDGIVSDISVKVETHTPVRSIPVEKPVSKPTPVSTPTERERGEEMPIGFGFGGFGGGMPIGGGTPVETPVKGEPVKGIPIKGIPVLTEMPTGAVSVEDFAKMVARFVAEELANRLAR